MTQTIAFTDHLIQERAGLARFRAEDGVCPSSGRTLLVIALSVLTSRIGSCGVDDEAKVPGFKRFLHEVETNVAKSVIHDYTDGEKQVADLFGRTNAFPNPKPTTSDSEVHTPDV